MCDSSDDGAPDDSGSSDGSQSTDDVPDLICRGYMTDSSDDESQNLTVPAGNAERYSIYRIRGGAGAGDNPKGRIEGATDEEERATRLALEGEEALRQLQEEKDEVPKIHDSDVAPQDGLSMESEIDWDMRQVLDEASEALEEHLRSQALEEHLRSQNAIPQEIVVHHHQEDKAGTGKEGECPIYRIRGAGGGSDSSDSSDDESEVKIVRVEPAPMEKKKAWSEGSESEVDPDDDDSNEYPEASKKPRAVSIKPASLRKDSLLNVDSDSDDDLLPPPFVLKRTPAVTKTVPKKAPRAKSAFLSRCESDDDSDDDDTQSLPVNTTKRTPAATKTSTKKAPRAKSVFPSRDDSDDDSDDESIQSLPVKTTPAAMKKDDENLPPSKYDPLTTDDESDESVQVVSPPGRSSNSQPSGASLPDMLLSNADVLAMESVPPAINPRIIFWPSFKDEIPKLSFADLAKKNWLCDELEAQVDMFHPKRCHISNKDNSRDTVALKSYQESLFPVGRCFASYYQLQQVAKMVGDAWGFEVTTHAKKISCTLGNQDPSRKVKHATLKDTVACPFFLGFTIEEWSDKKRKDGREHAPVPLQNHKGQLPAHMWLLTSVPASGPQRRQKEHSQEGGTQEGH